MEISTLVSVLDQPHVAADHLQAWGLHDVARAQAILLELSETGLTLDLLAAICEQLGKHLPNTPDPDAALAAFGRYLLAVRSPLALASLCERDPAAMPMLLGALSLGPRWAAVLISDPEAFDLLRQTDGEEIARNGLVAELVAEVEALESEDALATALARARQRHLLRVAYGDVVGHQPLRTTFERLTNLGEALVEAALTAAWRRVRATGSAARGTSSKMGAVSGARCAIVAIGELGAGEPGFGLPLQLLFVFEPPEGGAAVLTAATEFFDRMARTVSRILRDAGCTVEFLSLPDSKSPVLAHAADDFVVGFDSFGRTWHRREMLEARWIGGDHDLGRGVLSRLETWIFRRYLSGADETGIKALKRRILLAATIHQDDWRNVRQARGGLYDIEETVALLQLLAGGDQPAVRCRGTFEALSGLEQAGTITADESRELGDSYGDLRRLEHHIQILLGLQTSELPNDVRLMEQIASNLDSTAGDTAAFELQLRERLSQTWQTLHRLLQSAFPEEPPTPREVELLLDPAPPAEETRAALAPFGFEQPAEALAMLNDLATEQVAYLSTRRCRHLLAAILPQLLCAVGRTPQPDRTLSDLVRVSSSLGGKGVLWDLFGFHPPSLDLYVRLCSASTYLADILTTNPGMIDELIDSLQLDKLPSRQDLEATLTELCRGAADTLDMLRDFKNAEHLRIGVRDILGKEDIDQTHGALADVAETCLAHVARLEFDRLVEKYGQPTIGLGPFEGEPSRLVILGLGRLGGREPNYHSPLDLLFLYEAEGTTQPSGRSRRQERTANNHFYTQLVQRIIKQLGELTAKGRLYTIEMPLRPIGIGGALAMTFDDFSRHFQNGAATLWHWQALCQATPVFGERTAAEAVSNLIRQRLAERSPQEIDWPEMRRSRLQMESGANRHNLKRGPGGVLDVEFLVQMLQLQQAGKKPSVLVPSTQAAIAALADAGAIPSEMATALGDAYRFLRRVESGVRLLDTAQRHDLPATTAEMQRLALLLGHGNPERLRQQCLTYMAETRAIFDVFTVVG
jgi:glutamate-ammonia-ligase adenylyltransferase